MQSHSPAHCLTYGQVQAAEVSASKGGWTRMDCRTRETLPQRPSCSVRRDQRAALEAPLRSRHRCLWMRPSGRQYSCLIRQTHGQVLARISSICLSHDHSHVPVPLHESVSGCKACERFHGHSPSRTRGEAGMYSSRGRWLLSVLRPGESAAHGADTGDPAQGLVQASHLQRSST